MKKHLFSLICLLLALTLAWPAAFAETGETAAYAIEKKTCPYLHCFEKDTEHIVDACRSNGACRPESAHPCRDL